MLKLPSDKELLKTGVYCITNTANGKRYVGSAARSLIARWRQHLSTLRRGKHPNRHLQGAWKIYGEDVFAFSVLCLCDPQDCVANEQKFINDFASANDQRGYNIAPEAGSCLGVKHTDETKAKLSKIRMGKPMPPFTAEHIANLSAAHVGVPLSPQRCKQIGDMHRGKPKSLEQRKKMSIAAKGKPKSIEHRRRLSEVNSKDPRVLKRLRMMADARRGIPLSTERRAKMAESQKRRRAAERAARQLKAEVA